MQPRQPVAIASADGPWHHSVMPTLQHGSLSLHYEEFGEGFPLLLFAPGGMRSAIPYWDRAPFNPIVELSSSFRIIAMDQRNAGESRAPVTATDGWQSYSEDHVRLLDHLGIERCVTLGGCIGGAFCLALAQAAEGRIAAAVLQQPIGSSPDNREVFFDLFDSWAKDVAPTLPDVTPEAWLRFRDNMYGGDFVFSVSRDFVRRCSTPLLVLMGNDVYHPTATSREIADIAPSATLIEQWKDPDIVPTTVSRVRDFLTAHAH
jgi:pimeloyl-ACP methyl ester carboxylesterase